MASESPLGAIVTGSGVPASDTRAVPPFSALELTAANDVAARIEDAQTVVVTGDDNVVGLVTTEVRDGVLVIGRECDYETVVPLAVEVTVPSLTRVDLRGSGLIRVDGLDAERFTVAVPGSGVVRASGAADRLEVDVSGSGTTELAELVARSVLASLSGSGQIRVTATEALEASVPGAGVIFYSGSPRTVTRDVAAAGAILEE